MVTPGVKNHMRNLDNFRQAVASPKSWHLMDYFLCPKNTFLQLKQNMPKIYLTLLSATCVKIHQITYVIFETISHFSWHNSCIFLAQTLYTFYKSSPSKCKFSDFPLLGLKFTKFLMSFFKQKVFLQRFHLLSVSWEIILLYFFSWDFICYWEK